MESPQIIESVKVPNFFYDLIVFMTPSLTLAIGINIGLGDFGFRSIAKNLELVKLEGLDFLVIFILIFILFLFAAYEYGRFAEALSACISDIVRFLRDKTFLFNKQKCYNIDFKKLISKLNLNEMLDDDQMDKWTIYFYAMRFQPAIGSDILKRYAWEKLSRSSAFTFGVLFCISFFLGIIRTIKLESLFGYGFLDTGIFGFGSLAYTLGAFFFFTMTCYEYYRRKAWNNDLLCKILPVIILPDDFVVHRVDEMGASRKEEKQPAEAQPKRANRGPQKKGPNA